jgi:hypothetical protein
MSSHRSGSMASHKSLRQSDIPQRNPATRLPVRNAPSLAPSQRPIPTPASSSKLMKRNPSEGRDNEQANTAVRSIQKAVVSRLAAVEEAKRESPSPSRRGYSSPDSQPSRSLPHPSSRIARFEPTRTPSLVSGSSASTMDSPRSNMLRRKPVLNSKYVRTSPSDSKRSQEEQGPDPLSSSGYKDPFPDAVLGITMPPSAPTYYKDPEDDIIQLDQYVSPAALITENLPPPTPLYALSATPSTGYSPGPFSVTSTPTSMSSHSTSLVLSASPRLGQRMVQPSPTRSRPSTSRRKTDESVSTSQPEKQASARESSSSSASTIRPIDSGTKLNQKAKLSPMPAPPPSPPPRKLSATSSTTRSRTGSDARSPEKQAHPQSYPEFAHLNQVSPRKRPTPSSAPVRPSRDGTPEINFQRQVSPVIQSNMSSLPANLHKRQSSTESKRTNASGLSLDTGPRFMPKRSLSRNPSPSPSQTSAMSPLSSRPPTRGITPDLPSDSDRSIGKVKATPPTGSKPFSRFGFFSKKSKTEQGPSVLTKERPPRKGPAAGTGHEGYGKFAARGRSGSTTSGSGSTSVGRSPSADSTSGNVRPSSRKSSVGSKSGSDVDEFLSERLAPITIRGTGPHRPALERTQSEASSQASAGEATVRGLGLSTTTSNASTATQHGALKRPVLLPSLMSDPIASNEPVKRPTTAHSEKSDSGKSSRFGMSSKRTSLMSFMDSKSSSAASSNSNVIATAARKGSEPVGLGRTRTGSSDVSDREGGWPRQPRKAETLPKVSASTLKPPKRWGFFQRAKSPARKEQVPEPVLVTVPRQTPTRSVAHYAIMDPLKKIDLQELERIMSEAEKDSDHPDRPKRERAGDKMDKGKRPMHGDSMLLPEPPTFNPELAGPPRPASPKVSLRAQPSSTGHLQPEPVASQPAQFIEPPPIPYPAAPSSAPVPTLMPSTQKAIRRDPAPAPAILTTPTVQTSENQPRPSRLQQVGRIPRVVSRRERQIEHERKLSEVSFSRPFAPSRPSPALRTSIGNALNVLSRTEPELRKQPDPSTNLVASPDLATSPPTEEDEQLSPELGNRKDAEFMAFPPRKDSEMSTGSSSSGILRFVAPPGMHSGEDEIWKEYDDFLDALSPRRPKTPKSAVSTGSSAGAPFHYALSLPLPQPQPGPSTSGQGTTSTDVPARPLPSQTTSSAAPPPPPLPLPLAPSVGDIAQKVRIPSTTDSLHLSVIPPLVTPTSPLSISEFLNGYGERNLSVIDPTSGRLSLPSTGRFSTATSRHSLPASVSSPTAVNAPLPCLPGKEATSPHQPANNRTEPRLIEMAEKENMGFESMANLRFGALMTSKWLSFGRVLFSPIHNELKDPAEDRVLVIDGLGKGELCRVLKELCAFSNDGV